MEVKLVKFSNSFLWGTAISSYQAEGGNDEWSDWGGWSLRAGKACDFWSRYGEYLDLAKALGTNAFRFSIEWARVNPAPEIWNEGAFKRYREIVLAAKIRGLEPMVTLWHFTLPKWIAAKGGWADIATLEHFLRYVRRVAETFGDEVRYWIVINEPFIVLTQGYLRGTWPPGHRFALRKYFSARANVKRAVIRAAEILREVSSGCLVGSAFNMAVVEAARAWNPADRFAAWVVQKFDDREFAKSVSRSLDFIGLNYYMKLRLRAQLFPFPTVRPYVPVGYSVSDLGWEIYPDGLFTMLKELYGEFRKPIIVTENGIADYADSKRSDYIRAHLDALQLAIVSGVDVHGYFHWSLIDNFEWAEGFSAHFGLYGMDYAKMHPYERESCRVYQELIRKYRQN